MLEGIHILLTYKCTLECDHCFVYGSPFAECDGTFTLEKVRGVLEEAGKIGVDWVYFEGGEPFLFYPLMLEGARMAAARGFKIGIVTNAYYATSDEDAELWLEPLAGLGIGDLSISDDSLHHGEEEDSPSKRLLRVAGRMGFPAGPITINVPEDVMFKGRAAEKLAEGLPLRAPGEFDGCPYEELAEPGRVHVDAYGNVHICQGISMGNMWETPLSELVAGYDAASHPICGPLVRGGPSLLAKEFGFVTAGGYVDACHLCYSTRLSLLERYPRLLAPRRVYGLE